MARKRRMSSMTYWYHHNASEAGLKRKKIIANSVRQMALVYKESNLTV